MSKPTPPTSFNGFPEMLIDVDQELYRFQNPNATPVFSGSVHGRFNLNKSWGTVYAGLDPVTAMGQTISATAGMTKSVYIGHLLRFDLLTVTVTTPHKLADLSSPEAISFGVTPELFGVADTNFNLTRRWARALHKAGFDGVAYPTRYADTTDASYIGLFGRITDQPPLAHVDRWIFPEEAAAAAGYRLAETPRSSQLIIL